MVAPEPAKHQRPYYRHVWRKPEPRRAHRAHQCHDAGDPALILQAMEEQWDSKTRHGGGQL